MITLEHLRDEIGRLKQGGVVHVAVLKSEDWAVIGEAIRWHLEHHGEATAPFEGTGFYGSRLDGVALSGGEPSHAIASSYIVSSHPNELIRVTQL